MKNAKKLLSLLLCMAMLMSLLAVSAGAVYYEAPSAGMEADDSYINGAAYAASTVALSILGVNVTSSNGAGIYNAGGSTDADGTDSSNLGIFGSDISDNPDPYLYNYFYNLSSTGEGGGDYSVEDYASWTATPYTLRWDSNKQGPQGQASGSVTISLNGEEITANPAFFHEPELILGNASGYADELAAYQESYNPDYDPTIVTYVSDNGTRSDGLDLEYNMFAMSAGLVAIAEAVEQIEAETGKTTRYGDAYEIATNYDKFNRGLYYWAQSQFESGGLTEINYASSLSYDADSEQWLVSEGSGRAAQYASGIGNDIFDIIAAEGVKELVEVSEGASDQGGQGGGQGQGGQGGASGGMGGGSASSGYYVTTEELIGYLTVTGDDGTVYPGVVIGTAGSDDAYTELSDAGITFLGNLPSCVYGMTMQTTENGMGIAFYLSYFYYGQNDVLSPVNMLAFWMEHFYHVSDTEAMQSVLENMLESADINPAYYYSGSVNIDEYDDASVEALIADGIEYYLGMEDELQARVDAGEGALLVWSTLDTDIGIGSGADAAA